MSVLSSYTTRALISCVERPVRKVRGVVGGWVRGRGWNKVCGLPGWLSSAGLPGWVEPDARSLGLTGPCKPKAAPPRSSRSSSQHCRRRPHSAAAAPPPPFAATPGQRTWPASAPCGSGRAAQQAAGGGCTPTQIRTGRQADMPSIKRQPAPKRLKTRPACLPGAPLAHLHDLAQHPRLLLADRPRHRRFLGGLLRRTPQLPPALVPAAMQGARTCAATAAWPPAVVQHPPQQCAAHGHSRHCQRGQRQVGQPPPRGGPAKSQAGHASKCSCKQRMAKPSSGEEQRWERSGGSLAAVAWRQHVACSLLVDRTAYI